MQRAKRSVAGKECAVWSNQSVGAPCPLWLVRVIRKDSPGPRRRQGQRRGGLGIVLQWHKLQRCHAQSSIEPGRLIPKPGFRSRFATSGVGVRQRGCQQRVFQAVQVDCGDKAVHSPKSRFNEYKHFGWQSFLAGGDAVFGFQAESTSSIQGNRFMAGSRQKNWCCRILAFLPACFGGRKRAKRFNGPFCL